MWKYFLQYPFAMAVECRMFFISYYFMISFFFLVNAIYFH